MGEFGWAYISGSGGGSASGGGNAIQIQKTITSTTGSLDFTYDIAARKVELTGTLSIEGKIGRAHV